MELIFLNNVNIVTCLVIIVGLVIMIIMKSIKYCDRKNQKLIQLYLELKFLHKNLNNLENSLTSLNFSFELIESIKEYYNLEEIIIFDSINMEFKTSRPKVLKKEIHDFLQKNFTRISKNFTTQEYIKNKIKVNGKEYVLYIFKLAYNSDGFVVCVEDFPSLLTNYELLGLATNVALLKVNLLHE